MDPISACLTITYISINNQKISNGSKSSDRYTYVFSHQQIFLKRNLYIITITVDIKVSVTDLCGDILQLKDKKQTLTVQNTFKLRLKRKF